MSAFVQSFKLGFLSGTFNGLFGGCSAFRYNYFNNPFYNCAFSSPAFSFPVFSTPMFSYGSFMPYSSPLNIFNSSGAFSFDTFQATNSFSIWNNSSISSSRNSSYDTFSNTPTVQKHYFIKTNDVKRKEVPANEEVTIIKPVKKKDKKEEINYDVKALKARWKAKKPGLELSDKFYQKIVKISKNINCDPNDLMGIINLETAGTFSPSIKNSIGATGLIQFLPDTKGEGDLVKRVGKRISELEKMSAEEQLDYVEKYFKSHIKEKGLKGRIDGATLYSIVFWPAAANKDENYVIAREGSKVYKQNPLLDKDRNPNTSTNTITKRDLGERLKDFIA